MKLIFVTIVIVFGFMSNFSLAWTQANLISAPDTGTPNGQRVPGGTRPGQIVACKQLDQPITALVPENAKGLTTAEYPSFWFYIPYRPQDIYSIEFSLHDQQEKTTLYRTFPKLAKTPGIIGITLPPNPKNSLQLNQNYHWYFKVNCNSQAISQEDDVVLEGWVTRIQPNSNDVIWYDELTNLAKNYMFNPNNSKIKNKWENLLKSVGLQGLASAPIVSSVNEP
ncbi:MULTISPECIES: DUF928 domain-containing protein [Fischerella]|uniref:DUF928 domain-containing protein n=1 Tax=Fischerella muscicola CCMEE 5323 TaxID=2019572 RepID=A0A2N6K3R7_FISMU|nr:MULTISPECIES: DUF928 domain-containing protein [Fischerella]MBD2430028.1 DUF928 domain-containing protein [Fischerella sp. FACHB-380]PLZ90285.1 DUF928 domain-containing protein [Fischerella muscicola CCMEE 5323]